MKHSHIIGITFISIFILTFFGFYKINEKNYIQHKNIQRSIVKHPEGLPHSDIAKLGSFGFISISADLYWLQTIQYIGGNVIGGEYKKYLSSIIDLVTDLNPYFESPYIIGQLLLPSSSEQYEEFTGEETLKNIRQGEEIGLKGIRNFCDLEKISAIKAQDNIDLIATDPKYANPCESYKIPYYLGYIYYFYLKQHLDASEYYKIVSAQDDAPQGAKVLAAIMQGKGGNREKSLHMFLSLAKSTGSTDEACSIMSHELKNVYNNIHTYKIPIAGELIQQIESLSKQVLPKLTQENENDILNDTKCSNFLAKSIRELNLMYIEQGYHSYKEKNISSFTPQTPESLFQEGYINFIPTDYQQYSEEGYGIHYVYDNETDGFDYKIRNY